MRRVPFVACLFAAAIFSASAFGQITNTINAAQETTQIESSLVDATHPQYLAKSITYTPWGAESTLENGCASSSGQEAGCTDTLETYVYNHRMQPAMIELGNTSNAAAYYCPVYNYYAGAANPTSCAMPGQGTNDNGDVAGVFYQDNVNASLSHTATYTYDALNRLETAVATGNATYNLTYEQGSGSTYLGYDRFGNMTCVQNSGTSGECPTYTFNQTNNRITNTGFTYDAAGDLTDDTSHSYQWNAEGKLASTDDGNTRVAHTSRFLRCVRLFNRADNRSSFMGAPLFIVDVAKDAKTASPADPAGRAAVDLSNPQSWNAYAYVLNNPMTLTDPSGLHGTCSSEVSNENGGCQGAAVPGALESDTQTGTALTNKHHSSNPVNSDQEKNNQPKNTGVGRTPVKGPPNTKVKYPNGTEREFGPDGSAVKDIDSGHDHGKGDPHAHDWDHSGPKPQRGPGGPLTPEEKQQIQNAAKRVGFWGTVGVVTYWIISEGSRIAFPPRNLIPVP